MKKILIYFICVVNFVCRFSSCKSQNTPIKNKSKNNAIITQQINEEKTLKLINTLSSESDPRESEIQYVNSGCIFKNDYYFFLKENTDNLWDNPKKAIVYIYREGKTEKKEFNQVYENLYAVCSSENSFYTVESSNDKCYVVKYNIESLEMEKSVEIELTPLNCNIDYNYHEDCIIVSTRELQVKLSSDLNDITKCDEAFFEMDSQGNSYFWNYDKEKNEYSLIKYDSDFNVVYENKNFSDFCVENNSIIDGCFLQNDNPVVFCTVNTISGIVELVNVVDRDTGDTIERYDIKGAEYLWKGCGKYKFLFLKQNNIYGYINDETTPELIMEGDNANVFSPYYTKMSSFDNFSVLINYNMNDFKIPQSCFLVKCNENGEIISKTPYPEPNGQEYSYVLKTDTLGNNMYMLSYNTNENGEICETNIDVSEDGVNFNDLFSLDYITHDIFIDSEGYIYIGGNNEDNGQGEITIYNNKGKKVSSLKNNIFSILSFYQAGSNIYVVYVDSSANIKQGKINRSSSIIEEIIDMPSINGKIFSNENGDSPIWYYYDQDKNNLCRFTPETNVMEILIDFSGYDISGIKNIIFFDDELSMILTDNNKVYRFENKNKDIKTIEIFGVDIPGVVSKRIEEYNMTNSEYRIDIKNYGNDQTDISDAFDKLIMSGDVPDVLMTESDFNIQKYIKNGLFADLSLYIDSDTEIKTENYWKSLFDLSTYDSKMYQIIPYFYGKSIISDKDKNIEINDLKSFNEYVQEGNISGQGYVEDMIEMLLASYCDSNIDPKECKYEFDTELFKQTLETIRVLNKKNQDLNNSLDFDNIYNSGTFTNKDKDIIFNGIPSDKDSDVYINKYFGISISEKSKYKDEIWKFIREFLLEDFQDELLNEERLPVLKGSMEKYLNNYSYDGYNNNMVNQYNSALEKNVIKYDSPEKVKKIIDEQIQMFLSDDEVQSDQTAKNIQNEINLFIKEYY